MYVLTIRHGLNTRHIGPYESPQQAADQLDHWLGICGERAQWQIHKLHAPEGISPLKRADAGVGSPTLAA
jgi:hypothetical protein